jgi:hypothetical protein
MMLLVLVVSLMIIVGLGPLRLTNRVPRKLLKHIKRATAGAAQEQRRRYGSEGLLAIHPKPPENMGLA